MKDITIVCVSNRRPEPDYYCYDEFFASCRKFGFEPVVMGGEPGEYGGLGSKPRLIKQAIEAARVPTEHMLVVDCWDIVFAEDPSAVLQWYLDFGDAGRTEDPADMAARIVWNAEKNCFPDGSLAASHPPTSSPFRYLNSGFGIGETSAFLAALIAMEADTIPDDHTTPAGKRVEPCDQDYWMRALINGPVPMALDTQTTACLALCGVEPVDLDLTGPRICNLVTGSEPMAFHFNGGAKTGGLREPILAKLGYGNR